MNLQEEMKINSHQPCVGFSGTEVGDLFQETITRMIDDGFSVKDNVVFLMSQAYNYGKICGKREERIRRRK